LVTWLATDFGYKCIATGLVPDDIEKTDGTAASELRAHIVFVPAEMVVYGNAVWPPS